MGALKGWRLAVTVSLGMAAFGCYSGGSGTGGSSGSAGSKTKPTELPGVKVAAVATLLQASDCGDLLGRIRADVVAKIDAQATLLKKGEQYASYAGNVYATHGLALPSSAAAGDFANAGAAGSSAGAPSSQPTGTGASAGNTLGGSTTGTKSGATSAPTGHSDTNTQIKGVDEADIVKTDDTAEHIYLIHGNTLFTLSSWPAASTKIDGSSAVEGQASEMFIASGKAVVFSTIYNQGDIVPYKSQGGNTLGYANGDSFGDYYYQPYYSGAPFTKITTFNVTGSTPKVERELYIEGNYVSARRHGNTVRAVVQGGFHTPPVFQAYIEYKDPWGNAYAQEEIDTQVDDWRNRLVAAIDKTDIKDWVPVDHERKNGTIVDAMPRCVDFYAPPPALTAYGLTNIVSFDLTNPKSDLGGAIILGNSDTVFANDSVLVLAQRDWRYQTHFLEREQTTLHLFKLTDTKTTYNASGFALGHVLNQFSIDELAGTLRVATTQNIWQDFVEIMPLKSDLGIVPMAETRKQTDNRVVTLQPQGEELLRVGITPPLGVDGEQIKSARFLGDKGYVTTARQTDPLSVIDLSDPKKPSVLGELDIPGFSDYMHPLDARHLLTIGRNTDPMTGRDIGLALQIFDVSDPTHPTKAHSADYAPNGWSEANSNHKAFTYWVPDGQTDGLLAFPYVQYGAGFQSTLEVYRVSATKGFTHLGSIAHTPFFGGCYDQFGNQSPQYYQYYYCQQPEVRRGLFIEGKPDTYVYSISYAGVLVNSLSDLTTALAQVPLPAPDYNEHREGTPMLADGGAPVGTTGTTSGSGGAAGGISTTPVADAGVPIDTKPLPAADGGMAPSPAPDAGVAGSGG
ncbi:MAG TPA: beta-propeller domain-containing protein [Polyangiales bacterium]